MLQFSFAPVYRVTAGGLLLAALFCPLSSCSKAPRVEAREPQEVAIPAVAVAKVGPADLFRAVTLTAEFKPFQEVDLMAKVAGYVKEIKVDVGDRVQQGQLLAILEIPEMADDEARGRSMVSRSEAELARAKDELQRAETMQQIAHLSYTRLADVARQKAGLVAQQEIDDAQSKDLVAQAQVNAAKSNYTAAEQQVQVSMAELRKTKTLSDYTRVTAPFAGVVTRRYADTGSMLPAGTSSSTSVMPLVKLSQNSLLRLILPVPESAVPSVKLGQQVAVKVPSLNRSFPGRVSRFTGKIQTATRTMETEVDVQNPDLILVPGMYAEVNLTLERRNGVLAAPITAVTMGAGETSGKVAVVNAQNRMETRTVQLGMQDAANVEIRSGLQAGDLVVTGNRAELTNGQEVRPKIVELAAGATP